MADLDQDTYPEMVISARWSYVTYIDVEFNISVVFIPNKSDKISLVEYGDDGDLDFLEENSLDVCVFPSGNSEVRYWINNGQGEFLEKVETVGGVTTPVIIEVPVSTEDSSGNDEKSGGGGSLNIIFIMSMILLLAMRPNRPHWHGQFSVEQICANNNLTVRNTVLCYWGFAEKGPWWCEERWYWLHIGWWCHAPRCIDEFR